MARYLELLGNEENFGLYTLRVFDLSQFLKLDAAAARALNLFPAPGAHKAMSVAGLLDQCRTLQGRRLLHQWVKQPLLDRGAIEDRLSLVDAFFHG